MSTRPSSFALATAFAIAIAASLTLPNSALATMVRIDTVRGSFDINLYDNATPATVTNFLTYVQNGNYTDSIIHRSDSGFVIQGGGFRTDVNANLTAIPANPAVTNEPVYSNIRGTIAMAKVSGNANSATNQWFINLGNNAANLDNGNGGFTVFGEVSGNGMDTVDDVASLPVFAFGSAFGEIPLQNYSAADFNNNVPVDNTHLIIVTAITVIDSTVDSAGAAGLSPTPTTATPPVVTPPASGGGGGGNTGLLLILGLLISCYARYLGQHKRTANNEHCKNVRN